MAEFGHLWAVAYDDVEQAERLRKVVTGLGWERHDLILGDVALVIRHAMGRTHWIGNRSRALATSLAAAPLAFSPAWWWERRS